MGRRTKICTPVFRSALLAPELIKLDDPFPEVREVLSNTLSVSPEPWTPPPGGRGDVGRLRPSPAVASGVAIGAPEPVSLCHHFRDLWRALRFGLESTECEVDVDVEVEFSYESA